MELPVFNIQLVKYFNVHIKIQVLFRCRFKIVKPPVPLEPHCTTPYFTCSAHLTHTCTETTKSDFWLCILKRVHAVSVGKLRVSRSDAGYKFAPLKWYLRAHSLILILIAFLFLLLVDSWVEIPLSWCLLLSQFLILTQVLYVTWVCTSVN